MGTVLKPLAAIPHILNFPYHAPEGWMFWTVCMPLGMWVDPHGQFPAIPPEPVQAFAEKWLRLPPGYRAAVEG